MQALVDKYRHFTDDSPYLFPFLHDNSDEEKPDYQLYHNAESRITYHLKKLKQQLGIQGNLTLYVARHSWATAAKPSRPQRLTN